MSARSGAGEGFDRIKRPEERLLDRRSGPRMDAPGTDAEGRAALFPSGPSRDRQRERRTGTPARSAAAGARTAAARSADATGSARMAVHCSRCDATSPLDAGTALRAALPLFLFHPWRDHPLFAVCPSCRRRAWLRVET